MEQGFGVAVESPSSEVVRDWVVKVLSNLREHLDLVLSGRLVYSSRGLSWPREFYFNLN